MSDVSRGPAQKKTLQLCIYNDICYKIIKSQIIACSLDLNKGRELLSSH